MPPARVARPAERPQRVHGHKHKLETTQVLPTLSQQFSHFFLLGASSPNARAVTTTSSLKEIQHQGQSRKEPTSGGMAQDDSTLPIPIPETGIRPTLAQVPDYPPDFPEPTLTISNTFTITAGSGRPSSSTMRFSSMSTASFIPTTTLLLSTSPSSSLSAIHSPIPQRTLSSTLIAVLAIGASCLVLFVFILIKICSRPRDRPRLTPSLPILDKKYLDELESKESPIFGGKERVSPNMGLDDEWMNGCYASLLSSFPQPLKVTNFGAASQINEHGTGQLHCSKDKASYPESGGDIHCTRAACNLNGGSSRVGTAYQAPYQQIQDAITQTMKRLSSVSLSLYPVSPRQNEVGIALSGQETPLTGDGYFHMPRSKSKICKVTDRQSWQFHGPGHLGLDDVLVALPKSSAQGGRTRIKSPYYTPGVHSRISVSSMSNSSSKPKKIIPSKGICQVPSCQTYRDDLRGVQDSKDMKEETSEDQIKPANLLTPDPGATLGALLISEYPSEMNKSETYSEGPDSGEDIVPVSSLRLEGKNPIQVCRTTDKPPRVPSPPLLPSLTQMAMELRNREDFDNYRSPTYSIYGLYGEEGKSCGTSC